MPVEIPDIDEKEVPVKVTVLLARDTIAKLDYMSTKANLGSRGRTIEAIVDMLWDSQNSISMIVSSIKTMGDKPLEPQNLGSLLSLLFNMGEVLRRVDQFLGVAGSATR